jgi:hypothetical protein
MTDANAGCGKRGFILPDKKAGRAIRVVRQAACGPNPTRSSA